jgi:hypothetical protein
MSHFNCLYLNNSGHRWVNVGADGKHDRANVFFPESGETRSYSICYWEAIGSFAVPYVKIKGKRVQLTNYNNHCYMVNSETNRDFKYNSVRPQGK